MTSRIYSERFIRMQGAGLYQEIVVPPGYRAVVRNASIARDPVGDNTPYALVMLNAQDVICLGYQPTRAPTNVELRLVVYAGETIGGYTTHAGLWLTISGYLFVVDSALAQTPVQLVPTEVELERRTGQPRK